MNRAAETGGGAAVAGGTPAAGAGQADTGTDIGKTDTSQADTSQADTTKPDTSQADTSQADTTKPDTGRAGTGKTGATKPDAGPAVFTPGPLWMQIVPPAVTLAVMIWGIQAPSYWRDEAATLASVQRPFSQLLRMLGNIDAVHGAYYVLLWPLVRLAGSGELVTRLPSAICMAVAAAFIAGLGRRLVSPRAGLAAGLVFAIVPQVSFYGQDARPYAATTALAAAASYLLVRALGAAASDARMRGWLVGYAACLGVLGNLDPFALLLVAAHAVPVALAWLRRGDAPGCSRLAIGWLAAVAAGVVIAGPVLALGYAQRGTLNWLKAPGLATFGTLLNLIGPGAMVAVAALAVVCAIVVSSARPGQRQLRATWPGGLLRLCLPWLFLPAAILLAVSVVSPVYTFRYVVFCTPAAALLVGAGLSALGWVAGTAALAILTVLAVPAQLQVRTPGAHGTNIRLIDRIVASDMRPGDVLLYPKQQNFAAAYAYGLRQLPNIAQGLNAVQSGTLNGTELPVAVARQRLARATRVWLIQPSNAPPDGTFLDGLGFRLVRSWYPQGILAQLYARVGKG